MAIIKTAKNLNIKLRNTHMSTSGTMHETAEKIVIVATKENLTFISGKKINIKGNKS